MGAVTRPEVEKELFKIIAKLAGTTPDTLKPDDRLKDDLGFDSLKSLEAVSRITEIYEIDPDMDSLTDIYTLKDIVDYLMKLLA
jgi:acyl carrier protein